MVGSKEKRQGHEAEKSAILHAKLQSCLGKGEVIVEGKNGTKTDIIVGKFRISQKTPSGKNTQVWLPSQNTLFIHVPLLLPVKDKIIKFLGVPGTKRISADKIDGFDEVITALNKATKDKSLLNAMLLQVRDEDPVNYISWVTKIKGGGGFTLIDAKKYVDYVAKNGYWRVAPAIGNRGQTTLHLIDNLTSCKMFHLQAKGSGGETQKHNPMFHIHNFWPAEAIVAVDAKFAIPGI